MIAPVAVFEMEGSSYLIATPHFLVLRKTLKRSIERLGGGVFGGGELSWANRREGKGRETRRQRQRGKDKGGGNQRARAVCGDIILIVLLRSTCTAADDAWASHQEVERRVDSGGGMGNVPDTAPPRAPCGGFPRQGSGWISKRQPLFINADGPVCMHSVFDWIAT